MISNIRLQKFRSYRDESFELDPGVNIIVGPNASGKTNLLEALLVICRGSSYRAKDHELVAHGAPWARLDAQVADTTRTVKLMKQENGTIKKEFDLGGQKFLRMSLAKTIPTVLFEPNHLLLLHGSPDLRREYLDELLEQLVPHYAKTRRDYRRALAQRNALLKRGPSSANQLFAWNIRLSEIGALLVRERAALVEQINQNITELYQDLAHSKAATVQVRYQTQYDVEQYSTGLLRALEKRQDVDIERGFTTVGPHRDDLVVTFDDREASEVASRGETRTVLLALKIMELRFLEAVHNKRPLLLLDDVFSELDGARRRALTEVLAGYQTCLTTTDADVVVQHFMNNCTIIPLTN